MKPANWSSTLVERAGVLPYLDHLDRQLVKDLRLATHRSGEAATAADFIAEELQRGLKRTAVLLRQHVQRLDQTDAGGTCLALVGGQR